MVYLKNIFALVTMFILIVMGFLIKRREEKENDFIKRINKHFLHKYIILIMIVFGILFICISYIITSLYFDFGKYLFVYSILYFLISIEWSYLYMKIDIYFNMSKDNVINEFISFFANSDLSVLKYLEVITWFSVYNHNYFLQTNNQEEIDELISKLELLLKPSRNGLCLVYYHKEYFIDLCKKINGKNIQEKIVNIIQAEEQIRNISPEKYKLFYIVLDHNILIYLIIIGIHVVASGLVSKLEWMSFFGNFLFYLPNDILLILVHKGIVKNKQ